MQSSNIGGSCYRGRAVARVLCTIAHPFCCEEISNRRRSTAESSCISLEDSTISFATFSPERLFKQMNKFVWPQERPALSQQRQHNDQQQNNDSQQQQINCYLCSLRIRGVPVWQNPTLTAMKKIGRLAQQQHNEGGQRMATTSLGLGMPPHGPACQTAKLPGWSPASQPAELPGCYRRGAARCGRDACHRRTHSSNAFSLGLSLANLLRSCRSFGFSNGLSHSTIT